MGRKTKKQKNKKYKFTERYKIKGKYKKFSVTYDKNTAIIRKLALSELNKKANEYLDAKKISSLSVLIELYLQSRTDKVTPRSISTIKSALNVFENIDVNNIEFLELNALKVSELSKKRYNAVIRWAIKHNYITNAVYFELKPTKKTSKLDKYFTLDDIEKIRNNLDDFDKCLFNFLINTGLRIGEAFALTKDDVFPDRVIVNKSMNLTSGEVHSTKTEDSNRVVYIPYSVYVHYKDAIKLNPLSKEPFLRYNVHTAYNNFNNSLSKALDKKVSSHYCRHTFITQSIDAGLPIDALIKAVGHTDRKMIDDVYLHYTKFAQNKNKNILINRQVL